MCTYSSFIRLHALRLCPKYDAAPSHCVNCDIKCGCADVTNCQTPALSDLDPAIASAALSSGNPLHGTAASAAELPPPVPGGLRSGSCASVSRGGMGTRGSRGAISSRGTTGNIASSLGSMTDVAHDKVTEIQERGKAALTSHFTPSSPSVDV